MPTVCVSATRNQNECRRFSNGYSLLKLYDIINMNDEEIEMLKLKTRKRVVDNYDIKDIVNKYEELY